MALVHVACQRDVPIENIQQEPKITSADRQYADVFRPLDGHWRGTFYIYRDTTDRPRQDSILYRITPERLSRQPLRMTDSLIVNQFYESLTPYFQRVKIVDVYPGRGDTVISRGVNKVQSGQLWCVVRKPDETVIHGGILEGAHTIIWSREEQNPQKIELFREKVLEKTYEIAGWGYYAGQDTTRMPKYWFLSRYRRVDESNQDVSE